MQPPLKLAPDTLGQSCTQQMDGPTPDGRKSANSRQSPFLSRALDRLSFYRAFLREILQECRSLFRRIAALRKNNLYRCGIVPVTTFAPTPSEPHYRNMWRRWRNQCILSFVASHPEASLGDLRLVIEGWERAAEYFYTHLRPDDA